MYVLKNVSLEDTLHIGVRLGRQVQAGDVITLHGDLGAGKTTMAKAIAKGLDIQVPVSSPTFTIIKEYHQGRLSFYHFDLYRLGDGAMEEDLGYEEYFFGSGISVVEWSEFIEELLPSNRLRILITNMSQDSDVRQIEFLFDDEKWEPMIKEIVTQCSI